MLTARTEATDRMLICGERHLRTVLAQYQAHLRPPRPGYPTAGLSQKPIKRRAVLGDLINEYQRAA